MKLYKRIPGLGSLYTCFMDNFGKFWPYLCPDIFTCISVINHCYDEPCLNNGSCVNSDNGYQCICPAVSSGPNCEGEFYIDSIFLVTKGDVTRDDSQRRFLAQCWNNWKQCRNNVVNGEI